MGIDLVSVIANDKRMIAYRPEWREAIGSVTASILLGQIIYWWERSGRKEFYKFREPCKHHPQYQAGDSWCEELGFSKDEYNTALQKIGFKRNAQNKGEEHNMPVEYWTTMDRRTYFIIHKANLNKLFDRIYNKTPVKRESRFTKSGNPAFEYEKREPGCTKSGNPAFESSTETTYREKTTTTKSQPPAPINTNNPDSVVVVAVSILEEIKIPQQFIPYRKGIQNTIIKRLSAGKKKADIIRNLKYSFENAKEPKKFTIYLGKAIDNDYGCGYCDPEEIKPEEQEPSIQIRTGDRVRYANGQTYPVKDGPVIIIKKGSEEYCLREWDIKQDISAGKATLLRQECQN